MENDKEEGTMHEWLMNQQDLNTHMYKNGILLLELAAKGKVPCLISSRGMKCTSIQS